MLYSKHYMPSSSNCALARLARQDGSSGSCSHLMQRAKHGCDEWAVKGQEDGRGEDNRELGPRWNWPGGSKVKLTRWVKGQADKVGQRWNWQGGSNVKLTRWVKDVSGTSIYYTIPGRPILLLYTCITLYLGGLYIASILHCIHQAYIILLLYYTVSGRPILLLYHTVSGRPIFPLYYTVSGRPILLLYYTVPGRPILFLYYTIPW